MEIEEILRSLSDDQLRELFFEISDEQSRRNYKKLTFISLYEEGVIRFQLFHRLENLQIYNLFDLTLFGEEEFKEKLLSKKGIGMKSFTFIKELMDKFGITFDPNK